ncbi:MAG: putative glutamate--cysteine ligase 2-2 [Myxococcales bacterium]|nr:putative glutamate--cysteine ligase 2-2 [Myxococcales bacterium]
MLTSTTKTSTTKTSTTKKGVVAERPAPTTARDGISLGVEEEFHLVDLETRSSTARAEEVLGALASSKRTFAAELQQTVVETNSEVSETLAGLRESLLGARAELVDAAERLGIGIASAGTMPLAPAEIELTDTPRFQRMLTEYQLLVRQQTICGMQVHVGVADRDVAAALVDRLSPWLPPLLALSASSPFGHDGSDTGYASSRSLIWSPWPTTGSPGPMSSAAEYDAIVKDLIGSGAIADAGMIYFDVRPSSHLPTLELRVCDACTTVDTVVLIAGLFRAVVGRELARHAKGEPSRALHATLRRAAMWRASRSGLEGELVDGNGRAAPAAVVVRGLVAELRPELEATGDWKTIDELAEAALAHTSAAARQREAFRRRRRPADVVDLIVAETRGRIAAPARPLKVARGYDAPAYDEGFQADGQPRPSHAAVLEVLSDLGPSGLRARAAALEEATRAAGVVFRSTEDKEPHPFAIDLVPRVVTAEEWSRLAGGTAQRARALDAFLRDIYGEAAVVKDGILPARLARDAPGRREAGAAFPREARRTQVCGFDVVRDADGRWLVLEDNVRVPSGVAYAMASRPLLTRVVPEYATAALRDVTSVPALLRRALEESAPAHPGAGDLSLALLSQGEHDSAYFEHRALADGMNVPLVVPADLWVKDDRLYHSDGETSRALDVIYLRMEDALDEGKGRDGRALGPALLRAVRAGNLALANTLGNGIADDKAVYDYVPKLIEYYLGEPPLLAQVPTFHCAEPEERRNVLARLAELVVKPVDGYGGQGVVVGPHATKEELAAARDAIEKEPARFIAQEMVPLSTHPTHVDGKLEPRHVDLRVFVYYGTEPVVVPVALTRVAGAGSMVVNSSRGGGAKDTWILRDG